MWGLVRFTYLQVSKDTMHSQAFVHCSKDTWLPPVCLQANRLTRSTTQSLELMIPSSQFKSSKPFLLGMQTCLSSLIYYLVSFVPYYPCFLNFLCVSLNITSHLDTFVLPVPSVGVYFFVFGMPLTYFLGFCLNAPFQNFPRLSFWLDRLHGLLNFPILLL